MYFFAFVMLLISFANYFISDIRHREEIKQKQADRELAQKQAQRQEQLLVEILKELRQSRSSQRRRR